VLEHTVPGELFRAAADNEVLQIVFFSILFAVALSRVQGESKGVMLGWLQSLSEVMFKFVGLVMAFAPIGIGAAIAVTVGRSGLEVLKNLAMLVGTLYGALIVFVLIVLVPTALLFRIPIGRFWNPSSRPGSSPSRRRPARRRFPQAIQGHGALRRAAPHRRVRAAQPATRSTWTARRSISPSLGLRGAGGGHRHAAQHAAAHDAHADAHIEGCCRSAARLARDPVGRAHAIRPAARGIAVILGVTP
jgi:hypothetical protein